MIESLCWNALQYLRIQSDPQLNSSLLRPRGASKVKCHVELRPKSLNLVFALHGILLQLRHFGDTNNADSSSSRAKWRSWAFPQRPARQSITLQTPNDLRKNTKLVKPPLLQDLSQSESTSATSGLSINPNKSCTFSFPLLSELLKLLDVCAQRLVCQTLVK